jgi:2-dehydro-3-deoxy-D-gluconate 5-dehydrogenase
VRWPVSERQPLFDLTGQLAVVTGCRRGIGRSMALALARAGADIIGVSAHLEDVGSAVGAEVEAVGRKFTGHRVDLADRAAVTAFAAELAAAGRPIDILVNNAGTIRRNPAATHSDQDWDHVIEVDLTSQFVLAREIGRDMVDRGHGKIIFTASLLSFQGGINVIGYAAAKSGVAGITRALANEWAGHGVNVNAIVPGYIATDNTQPLQDDAARSRGIVERIPAGRWGRPDDIAGATVFLASPASDYVHGVLLPVDGGWLGR